jgi:outer membrane protein assembly factor BamB
MLLEMNKTNYIGLAMVLFLLVGQTNLICQDGTAWTHFRGSELNGIAPPGNYPVTWSDSVNISWKWDEEGRGWSSPVIYGRQVWLTTASADGSEMKAICIDFESGRKLHDIVLFSPDSVFRKHAVNSYATPTPAIEDGFVYVHFGRYGTACLNSLTGKVVWSRTDLQCEHIQGPGSSLLLHENKLFVHMEGVDVQEIYCLDKATGKTIWMAERDPLLYESIPEIGKKAYVTPIVIEVDGRQLLISNGSAVCNAYDVETGEEIWYIIQGEDSTISMPTYYKGRVYFYTAFVTPAEGEKYCELWCVDPTGSGDLTGNIQWRLASPILQLLTPVIHDGLLYTVDTRNILYCIHAESGKIIWEQRLKGKYNASPIVANNRIYIGSTRGDVLVLETGEKYEEVALNKVSGEIWATPAFVDESILLRTSKGLYRIKE